MAILSNAYAIALVALGLGFVIFLHELGHFLLAKWNDVKVEKFSIGFGPTLFGFRRGETEYVLAAIPLGGFVKMLGEGTEDETTKTTDPRAYPNKSVGARMAIISAGVIMNIFLGLACFVYAYGQGMDAIPAKVGAAIPGSPAYRAGMRPGDEIVSIDDRRDIKFPTLTLAVSLSRTDQVLRFGVDRPGREGPMTMSIQPVREPGSERPTIGILQSESLQIRGMVAPAGMTGAPRYPGADGAAVPKEFLDTLVAAGPVDQEPRKLAHHQDYLKVLAEFPDRPIKHVIERRLMSSGEEGPVHDRIEVTLPPSRFVDFGLRMTIGPVGAIQAGSPAEAAGFRVGDRIVEVEGDRNFDPMRLPSLCGANATRPMKFVVERASVGGEKKEHVITATPEGRYPWTWSPLSDELDVPGLGLCFPVTAKVAGVRPGSPADRAGIKAGDVVNSMIVKRPKTAESKPGDEETPVTLDFDKNEATWPVAFGMIQRSADYEIEMVVNKSTARKTVKPETVEGWLYPDRGLLFYALRVKMPPMPIASALRLGYDDTIENILSIYAMFRSLATGRVGPKSLGGIITIAGFAYSMAQTGLTYLIHFLGILSINLAVLNFLPIPPLDGGQMVFLIAEKVRGRPLPESALVAGTYFGLFLVLGLMIFVTIQDIVRWVF